MNRRRLLQDFNVPFGWDLEMKCRLNFAARLGAGSGVDATDTTLLHDRVEHF